MIVIQLEVKDCTLYSDLSKVTAADVECSNGVVDIFDTGSMASAGK